MDIAALFETNYIFTHDQERSKFYVVRQTCTKVGAKKLQRPGRYFRVSVGGSVGVKRTWFEAVTRVRELLKRDGFFGQDIVMRAYGSDDSFLDQVRFRKVKVAKKVPDTPASPGVDAFMAYVKENYPRARFAGACVCKPSSDHADCAAVDYFDTAENMRGMRDADFFYQDTFRTKYGILFDTISFPDGEHDRHDQDYDGQYHTHYHHSSTDGVQGSAC